MYDTTKCNFQCTYCYENDLGNQELNKDNLEKTIRFIFNNCKEEKVNISFMGGEPLLRKDLLIYTLNYIKKNYHSKKVQYFMTTNASLIDDELLDVFEKNNIKLRISFDGKKDTFLRNRISKNGIQYFEKICGILDEMKKREIEFTVRMTVVKNNVKEFCDNVLTLFENEYNDVSIGFDVRNSFEENEILIIQHGLEKINNYMIEQYKIGKLPAIDIINGKIVNRLCNFGNSFSMCSAGIETFKIMTDGNIYPCDFVANDKKFLIGNIADGIMDVTCSKKMVMDHFKIGSTPCDKCQIKGCCHAMKCGYWNYIKTGYINIPAKDVCEIEKASYIFVTKFIQETYKIFPEMYKEICEYIVDNQLKLSKLGIKVFEYVNKNL